MKDTEFAFAVARVRSNEYKLLSSSVIESLINASDYNEALKILSESGYEGINADNEEKMLDTALKNAFDLVYESAPDRSCLDFLIVSNDFHNIKAILKCRAENRDASPFLVSPYSVEPSLIKEAFDSKDYSALPSFLQDVCKTAYDLLTTTNDGQSLEIYLDKKGVEASLFLARETKDEFSQRLSLLMAALSNIKVALRCMKTGKDREFTLNALADIDTMDKTALCDAAMQGQQALCDHVSRLGFEKLSESIKKGYAAFEKTGDDMIIREVQSAKYRSLGISPLAAFCLATDAEVKTLRIILSCKKNKVAGESIRERVRELYV